MNLQQFQYILAVAAYRHFETAAEKCYITQSTLSTMISKLEDEIGIQIFDRKKKPVEITREGALVIEQLKKIQVEIAQLTELTQEIKGEIAGELTISVIPTIAPYLLPRFLNSFAANYPDLTIEVKEQTTGEIIRQLKSRDLDIGIVSVPVKEPDIVELKLYDEPFVLYDAAVQNDSMVKAEELDLTNLCLLEEGHCMRTQILELCDFLEKQVNNKLNFRYKAGSIDSLLRFVRANHATTLLPYLAAIELPDKEQQKVSYFADPVPYRSVGLVVHRHFVRKNILKILHREIMANIAGVLTEKDLTGKKLMPL